MIWFICVLNRDVNVKFWPRPRAFGRRLVSVLVTWPRKCAIKCKIIPVVSISWLYHCNIHYKDVVKHCNSVRVGSITSKMYFNYKIQITFLKSYSNTFFNYFGYDGQNTKYKIHFLKVTQNNKVSVIAVRQLGICLTSVCSVHRA